MKYTNLVILLSVIPALLCSGNRQSGGPSRTETTMAQTAAKDDSSLFRDRNYLLGRIEYSKYPDVFTRMEGSYTTLKDAYLRTDVLRAFLAMRDSALKDGITLTIISAARNFDRQKQIWEAKWNGERMVEGKNLARDVADPQKRALLILLYSSMPGTSRHHWGTDIDINNLEDAYFLSGRGKKEYEWLQKNASHFGFCQPYTAKGTQRPHGYEEEKWHWTWLPASTICLENYSELVKPEDIQGFKGAETAIPLDVINKYVLGIAPACMP